MKAQRRGRNKTQTSVKVAPNQHDFRNKVGNASGKASGDGATHPMSCAYAALLNSCILGLQSLTLFRLQLIAPILGACLHECPSNELGSCMHPAHAHPLMYVQGCQLRLDWPSQRSPMPNTARWRVPQAQPSHAAGGIFARSSARS